MKRAKITVYLLALFVLLSCTPRSYYYWSSDNRLLGRENFVHELSVPEHGFSMTLVIRATNYSGQRRVGLNLTFLNGGTETAKIDFRRIAVVADGQLLHFDRFFLGNSIVPISDSIDYVFVEPMLSSSIEVGADFDKKSGVPLLIELQLEGVVSIIDSLMEFKNQPIIFELLK